MNPIRVMIVDDHPAVRRGLRSLLTAHADIEVAGEAGDGASALHLAAQIDPDVVLLDVQMPGPDGVGIAGRMRQVAPNARIVILSAFDNEEYVVGALRAGAYAYPLKSTGDETVVDTLRQVHQGKRMLSPALVDKVMEQFETLARKQARLECDLDDGDVQMLRLLADGCSNEDISRELFWSERTLRRKLEEVAVKLGAKNRTRAVVEAMRRGLI